MQLFTTRSPLEWGELDLPLLGINSDWFGTPLNPPLAYVTTCDDENLWFLATRQTPASVLNGAIPNSFTPELWKNDTAELFIADPLSGEYLEFNLAPNGAWWAAKFSSPRKTTDTQPDFQNHIVTYHEAGDPSSWLAAIRIPLAFLRTHIRFGPGSTANPAFILNSPSQTFHSGTKLPGTVPDFHQPASFGKIIPRKLPPA